MPEGEAENPQGSHVVDSPNRRGFVKKSIVAGVAATAVIAGNEIKKSRDGGIVTDTAIYKPSLEWGHYKQDTEIDSLESADIYFREFMLREPRQPQDLLRMTASATGSKHVRAFPDEVINTIASNGAEAMVGDAYIPDTLGYPGLLIPLGVAAGSILALKKLDKDKGLENRTQEKINRRQLLKMGAAGGIVWGTTPIASSFLTIAGVEIDNDALRNITARMNSLQLKAHPEHLFVFFRDVVMANKMMDTAKKFRDKTNHKPTIIYNVGALHSGISDFLQADSLELTRSILTSYPEPVLQTIVHANGGLENFCSSTLVSIPALSLTDTAEQRIQQARGYVLTDDVLLQRLGEKLS